MKEGKEEKEREKEKEKMVMQGEKEAAQLTSIVGGVWKLARRIHRTVGTEEEQEEEKEKEETKEKGDRIRRRGQKGKKTPKGTQQMNECVSNADILGTPCCVLNIFACMSV